MPIVKQKVWKEKCECWDLCRNGVVWVFLVEQNRFNACYSPILPGCVRKCVCVSTFVWMNLCGCALLCVYVDMWCVYVPMLIAYLYMPVRLWIWMSVSGYVIYMHVTSLFIFGKYVSVSMYAFVYVFVSMCLPLYECGLGIIVCLFVN